VISAFKLGLLAFAKVNFQCLLATMLSKKIVDSRGRIDLLFGKRGREYLSLKPRYCFKGHI
jgi:hypothetical protein